MSSVDNRVVQMKFDNKQFESGVKTTINSLNKLKASLNIDSAARSLSRLEDYGKTFSVSVSSSVDSIADRFSTLGVIGSTVLSNLTTSAMNMVSKISNMAISPIISGGKSRALNIEQAKFQLEGLGIAWEDIEKDISYGVQDTAYGLDSAAKAASQLTASGVQLGDEMKSALRGISGVAAMTNSEYDDISRIFTTVAGNGRLMSDQLNQLGSRGLNAAATLAKALGVTEQEVREMTSKGQIDFKTFSDAMDSAYGEHAKDANKTFTGALSNMKAAMSRIGAKFATPAFENLKDVMNALIPVINAVNTGLDPLVDIATNGMKKISEFTVKSLGNLGGLGETAKKEAKNLEQFTEVAKQVINGDFGTGEERRKQLEALGYSYEDVQEKVRELLGATSELKDTSVQVPNFDKLISIIENFIKSIKNVGGNALKILKTINMAFKEVFPPVALKNVDSFMKKMENLTSKFKITDDTAGKLKNSFKGLFAILDIGEETLSAVKRILSPIVDNVSGFGEKILDVTDGLGDYIFKVDDTIKKNDTFYETLKKISDYVKTEFSSVIPKAKEFYESFCELIKPLNDELSKAKNSFSDFAEKGLSKEKLDKIQVIGEIFKSLIESVLNVGTAVTKIAKPISEAFAEMFPPIQLNTIGNLAAKLSEFTANLKVSAKTAYNIKSTFKGLFAAVDLVKQIFSALIRTVFPTTKHFGKLGDGILAVTSFLGEHIVQLDKTIRENDTFYNALQKVINFVKTGFDTAKTKVQDFAAKYEELTGKKLRMPTLEDFYNFIGGLKDKLSWVPDLIGKIKDSFKEFFKSFSEDETGNKSKAVETMVTILDKLSGVLGKVSPGVGEFFSGIGEAFDKIDFERMGKILNIAFIFLLIRSVNKLKSVLSTVFSFGRPFHNMNGILVSTKGALTALTNDIKSNTLVKVAQAISLLAASLIGLSMVKEERLTSAMGAMTSLFVELFGSMILMQKVIKDDSNFGLTKIAFGALMIAGAISVLAGAVKKLGSLDTDTLSKGLLAVITLLGAVTIALKYMPQSSFSSLLAFGAGLIVMSASLKILASAFKSIGEISFETLMNGMIGVISVIGILVAVLNYIPNATAVNSIIKVGASLIVLSIAMGVLTKAFKSIGEISTESIMNGLLILTTVFAMAAIVSKFVTTSMATSILTLSVSLVEMSVALNILTFALKAIGEIPVNTLSIGLMSMISLLGIFAVISKFVPASSAVTLLALGASLIVLSGALALLAPILKFLGSMELAEIGKSLLTLAAVLTIFGGAAAMLSPVLPAIVKFAGSIVLLGLSFVGLGVGLAALAFGLTALSASTVSITVFIYAIGQAIAALIESLVVVGMALLTGLETLIPKIAEVAFKIVVSLVQTLAVNIPLIVKSGMMLILGILQGIESRLDKIAVIAISIVVKLINAIAFMLPEVIQAGINLMVRFIDGMADGIRENTDKIFHAIQNLMSAIVEFALSTLQQLVRNIPAVGQKMVDGLEKAKSAVREALAPEAMEEIGYEAANAAADGIKSGNENVKEASSGLGNVAKNGLNSVFGDFGSLGTDFGTNFSLSLDGTSNTASLAGLNLGTSATDGLSSVMGDFSSLGTNFGTDFSSSLGDTDYLATDAALGLGEIASDGLNLDFTNIGANSGDTYASGLLGTEDDVKESTTALTSTATNNLDKANSKFKKSGSDNGTNYALGITSEKKRASNAGKNIAESGVSGSNSEVQGFRAAGRNSGNGFAAGLYDSESSVHNAAVYVAQTALNSMNSTLDINSPSREFSKIGMYSDKGLALGLMNSMGVVKDASEAVGNQAKKTLKKSLMKVSSALTDDIDVDPTIRPVVDLSDVTDSVEQINGLFGRQTLNLGNINARINDRNMQLLSDIVSGMQNGNSFDSYEIIKTINELRGDVAYLGDTISKMQIKMDTGALVGSIVTPMDEALGRRMTYKGRSN